MGGPEGVGAGGKPKAVQSNHSDSKSSAVPSVCGTNCYCTKEAKTGERSSLQLVPFRPKEQSVAQTVTMHKGGQD